VSQVQLKQRLAFLRNTPSFFRTDGIGQRPVPPLESRSAVGPERQTLGTPLTIREVASLIGCSAWTVRQSLMPRGLPHFRCSGHGRLTFFREQVIRWIEIQQQGGSQKR
jgi:hypothetical protein